MKEADFQAAVIELAELLGWRVYHTHDSRKSPPGFPDLTMVRGGRLIFAELKTDSPNSVTTDAQKAWLEELRKVAYYVGDNLGLGAGVIMVNEWRPRDWPDIEQTLKR